MVYVFQSREQEIEARCVLHRGEAIAELRGWAVGSPDPERKGEN